MPNHRRDEFDVDAAPFQPRFLLQELIFAHCPFLQRPYVRGNLVCRSDWVSLRAGCECTILPLSEIANFCSSSGTEVMLEYTFANSACLLCLNQFSLQLVQISSSFITEPGQRHREHRKDTDRRDCRSTTIEGRRTTLPKELVRQHTTWRLCTRGRCVAGIHGPDTMRLES